MTDQTSDLLSDLLTGAVEQLDIPLNVFETIVARYEHLGKWLADHFGFDVVIEIYPQGSMRLGTPVRPDPPLTDFDIDMVFLIRMSKDDVTKAELKDLVGKSLETYIDQHHPGADVPKLEERGRCWTLKYLELGFHLDVLPAIPDEDNLPTGILLTDRDLHLWQHSEPIGYADWFLMERLPVTIFERATAELAARLGKSIEEVPRFLVRTPLQRAVQVAKRHRDVYFADNPDDKPPSILVTTLIALSYEGGTNLRTILTDFIDALPQITTYENGTWWVPNPVAKDENFADKWNTHPGRREAFHQWCEALRADLDEAASVQGIDRMAAALSKSLGAEPVQAATTKVGDAFGAAAAVAGPAVSPAGHLTLDRPARSAPTRSMDPDLTVLSCGLQALGLRATWGAPFQVDQHLLRWSGELKPSPYSRSYLVDVRYRLAHHPEVSVREPALEPNDEGWLPHYYHHNDTLCLCEQGDWHPSMHLAWTTLPWTVEWLFHYEIWKATGIWHGSGDDTRWASGTPLADLPADLLSRRRGPRRTRSRLAA